MVSGDRTGINTAVSARSASGIQTFTITEGSLRFDGTNATLFHSFEAFSPGTANVVFDLRDSQNTLDTSAVNVLIGRVTGSSRSFIDGEVSLQRDLETPAPDVFLINPSGITFGPNTNLILPGSFVASSAERVLFEGGSYFSATDTAATPSLLSVSTPLGLQLGAGAGAVSAAGTLYTQGTGNTIALIGNGIKLKNAWIGSDAGHIELGSVNEQSSVLLSPSSRGWAFDYQNVSLFGDLTLKRSILLPDGSGSGSLQLLGDRIALLAGSQVSTQARDSDDGGSIIVRAQSELSVIGSAHSARHLTNRLANNANNANNTATLLSTQVSTNTDGNGGDLIIQAPNVRIADEGQIVTTTEGRGDAGDVTIQAQTLNLSRPRNAFGYTGLLSQTLRGASGQGGNINIVTQQLNVNDGAQVLSSTSGSGEGGEINLTTQYLQLGGGSRLFAGTEGLGNGGHIKIEAGNIEVSGSSRFAGSSSGLYTQVRDISQGHAGNILIDTDRLSLSSGGQVASLSRGAGNTGDIEIAANAIEVIGTTPNYNEPSAIVALALEDSQGKSGNITLEALEQLTIRDGGQIISETRNAQDAGNITITAGDFLLADAFELSESMVSAISTSSHQEATGNAGNLVIDANRLAVRGGAQIVSYTAGAGNGGNINIRAEEIAVAGTSTNETSESIISTAIEPQGVGSAGNINIDTQRLALSGGGQLFSGVQGMGQGGDISIRADEISVAGASASERSTSHISAAIDFGGQGSSGNIEIQTRQLTLSEGGLLSSGTRGQGNGGNIDLQAEEITVTGVLPISRRPSRIATAVHGVGLGNAGDLAIAAGRINVLEGGRITSLTDGQGEAGNIDIEVNDLLVQGNASPLPVNLTELPLADSDGSESSLADSIASTITASSNTEFAAGSLQITAQNEIALKDGANLSVSSLFGGDAGNLTLAAADLVLTGSSRIEAQVSAGVEGDIKLSADRSIVLGDNSQITTDATDTATGGNIQITTPVLVGSGNSDITANAMRGKGGSIDIEAEGVFGFEMSDRLTAESDITASSQIGVDGMVEIDSTGLDPATGLVSLPIEFVDSEAQVVAGCLSDREANFVATGRGGVPTDPSREVTPSGALQSFAVDPQGTPLAADAEPSPPSTASVPATERTEPDGADATDASLTQSSLSASSAQFVTEAQGWQYSDRGEIQLLSQAELQAQQARSDQLATAPDSTYATADFCQWSQAG